MSHTPQDIKRDVQRAMEHIHFPFGCSFVSCEHYKILYPAKNFVNAVLNSYIRTAASHLSVSLSSDFLRL